MARRGGNTAGPVFRPVGKGGRIGAISLGGDGFVRAIKRRAADAGLDPTEFAGHSLQSGFLTSAAEAGADVLKMAEVSRHRSMDTLRRYVRRGPCSKAMPGRGSCDPTPSLLTLPGHSTAKSA